MGISKARKLANRRYEKKWLVGRKAEFEHYYYLEVDGEDGKPYFYMPEYRATKFDSEEDAWDAVERIASDDESFLERHRESLFLVTVLVLKEEYKK